MSQKVVSGNANNYSLQRLKTRKIVGTAILSAIVVILQLLGSFIRFGTFSISLVLVPIVVGSAMYGVFAGGWLGLVFGATVLLSGDAALFIAIDPIATVFVVILKGILAGLCTGVVYRLLENVNKTVATIVAAFVCPVVNTGIFIIGYYLFFQKGLEGFASSLGFEGTMTAFLFTVLIGGNFIFEVLFNLVLSPTLIRIISIGHSKLK